MSWEPGPRGGYLIQTLPEKTGFESDEVAAPEPIPGRVSIGQALFGFLSESGFHLMWWEHPMLPISALLLACHSVDRGIQHSFH